MKYFDLVRFFELYQAWILVAGEAPAFVESVGIIGKINEKEDGNGQ